MNEEGNMAGQMRRRPLDMLGEMGDPGDPGATGLPVGAEVGGAGLPAEGDPNAFGPQGPEMGMEAPMDIAGMGGMEGIPGQQPALDGGMGAEEGMDPSMMDPSDLEAEQLAALLQDPSTPPEVKAQIEQLILMGAGRDMAGGI